MAARSKRSTRAADAGPKPRIGRKGPPIAATLPRQTAGEQLVQYKALDADPQVWFRVIQQADAGDTGPMIDMFSDARDRDSHLDGVVRKRVQSMMGRPIVFRPPDGLEGDATAQRVAADVRRILLTESRGFRQQLVHLMTGAAYGYSVSRIDWRTNAAGEYVPHLLEEYPGRFAFDRDTRRIGFYAGPYRTHREVALLADYPDQFVAHVPMGGRSDYPWRRGPMRSCIIPSFVKRGGLRFWLILAEMFGRPQPYAIVPKGVDADGNETDTVPETVKQALLDLSQYWAAAFTEGVHIESIPGSGNVSAEVHKELVDWAEMTMSIALLGQNLTTKVEGGAFAAAEAHRYVAADIHLSDSVELSETIAQQLVEPIVRYNWPGEPVPAVEISTGTKQVPTVDDVREGVFSEDERRRMLGHEAKADGTGAMYRRPIVQVPEQLTTEAPSGADEPSVEVGEVVDTAPAAPDEATAKDPSVALNGAQVQALQSIVESVAAGTLPRASGVAIIVAAFPISRDQAEEIMGSVGAGFAPSAAPEPEA